jgi:flagellar assembly factor FliW
MTEGKSVASMTMTEATVTGTMTDANEAGTELPAIAFVSALPGFPTLRDFVLVRIGDQGSLFALTSMDDPDLRFLVLAPGGVFFPAYTPEIDDEALRLLDVQDTDGLLVLLVVTAGSGLHDATANLLAPIIVDQNTRRAVQVVLNGSGLPVRAPLVGG